MPLTTAALDVAADAVRTPIDGLSLHAADPGTTGTNETTAARVTPTWTDNNDGSFSLAATASFTGGAASGPCTFVGLWAGATFYGSSALTGDQAFNAAGEYDVTALTVTGN